MSMETYSMPTCGSDAVLLPTKGGEWGGGGTENNRRGRLLEHTNKFTQ